MTARTKVRKKTKTKGRIDPTIGERVRRLRLGKGISQKDLAGPDFSKGFVSLLETGRTRVSIRAAGILAGRLGVSLAELVDSARVLPDVQTVDGLATAIDEVADGTYDPTAQVRLHRIAERARALSGRRLVDAEGVRARLDVILSAVQRLSETLA